MFLKSAHIMAFPNKRAAFPSAWESQLEADLMHLGSDLLAEGRLVEAIRAFDAAFAGRESLLPFLWQRGIAHYYLGRYVHSLTAKMWEWGD